MRYWSTVKSVEQHIDCELPQCVTVHLGCCVYDVGAISFSWILYFTTENRCGRAIQATILGSGPVMVYCRQLSHVLISLVLHTKPLWSILGVEGLPGHESWACSQLLTLSSRPIASECVCSAFICKWSVNYLHCHSYRRKCQDLSIWLQYDSYLKGSMCVWFPFKGGGMDLFWNDSSCCDSMEGERCSHQSTVSLVFMSLLGPFEKVKVELDFWDKALNAMTFNVAMGIFLPLSTFVTFWSVSPYIAVTC